MPIGNEKITGNSNPHPVSALVYSRAMLVRRFLGFAVLGLVATSCGDDSAPSAVSDDAGTSQAGDDDSTASGSDDDADDDTALDDDSTSDDDTSADDDTALDDDLSNDDDVTDDDIADDDVGDDDVSDDDTTDAAVADDDLSADDDAGSPASDDDTMLDAGVDILRDGGTTTTQGPGRPNAPPYDGGERLRALVYEGPDGAESFAGYFYDTELDTRCNFVRTGSDAQGPIYHCIAAVATFARFEGTDCSVPVASAPGCSTSSPVIQLLRPVNVGCPPEEEFYELGASLGMPELSEVNPGTLECSGVGTATSEQFGLVPFDPSKYVEGRLQVVPLDAATGFGERFIVGNDGSYVLDTLVVDDESCALDPTDTNADEGYCVPGTTYAFSEQYSDPSCSGDRVVGLAESSCREFAPSPLVKTYSPDARGCSRLSSVNELGAERPAQTVYEPNDGDCLDQGTPDHVFALGNEVPLNDFPHLQTVDVGGERLRSRFVSTAQGNLTTPSGWFDTDLGEMCTPRAFPDGIVRCVPYQTAFPGQYYADDTCTVQLYDTYATNVCGSLPARLFAVDSESDCTGPIVQQVFELSSYDGTTYTNSGGDCVVADPAADGNLVFEQSSEVVPSDLVTVQLVQR
jgi:hypothetical protein